MTRKFKCKHCKLTKYDIIYWTKNKIVIHTGIYCNKCKKYYRFLSKNDKIVGKPITVETKQVKYKKS